MDSHLEVFSRSLVHMGGTEDAKSVNSCGQWDRTRYVGSCSFGFNDDIFNGLVQESMIE